MGSGVEGTLSRFATDTKLCGTIDAEGKGPHPEGPGQAGEVGLGEPCELEPNATFCTWTGAVPSTSTDWAEGHSEHRNQGCLTLEVFRMGFEQPRLVGGVTAHGTVWSLKSLPTQTIL